MTNYCDMYHVPRIKMLEITHSIRGEGEHGERETNCNDPMILDT